jgi:RND family efflux transporter MFP subunit
MDLQPLKIDREESVSTSRGRRRRNTRWVAPTITLLVLGGLVWVFHAPILGLVDSLRLPEVKILVVRKSSPVSAAAATGTSSNGYIVAKTRAALSADTPGRIVELDVQEGSVVKKGDIVARLYSDEYAAALRRADADLVLAQSGVQRAQAEKKVSEDDLARLRSAQKSAEADVAAQQATLAMAELEMHRAAKLLENGVDTAERVDRAKSALDAAKALVESAKARLETASRTAAQAESQILVAGVAEKEALGRVDSMTATRDQAKATLDKTEVRAPFDGIVVLKDAEVGEVVSPNVQGGSTARGSVVTMVDFASLEVQAEVPETSLSAVVVGRPAKVYLDAYPDKGYAARVDRIWPTANRTKATVEVRVAFLERDDCLRPEMGVRVVFSAEGAAEQAPISGGAAADAKPVLLVPLDAVVKSAGEKGVFVLERDRVRFQAVALGAERGGRAVVEKGLADGDTIVLAPPTSLASGDRVRVNPGS